MDKFFRPCVAEMVGTFLICFIAAGALCTNAVVPGSIGFLGSALAYGIIASIAISATMNVSGGHLNPAITITKWVLGRIDTPQMLYYVAAQFMGALIAGGLVAMIFGATVALRDAQLGTPHVSPALTVAVSGDLSRYAMASVIEAILTFILVFAFFGTLVDPRAPKIGGFGIGLALMAATLVGGPLTGAAMNPVRYFGLALWEAGITGEFSRLRDFPVYIVGPVLGAIAAGWVYTSFILEPTKPEPKPAAH
ncbi:MAG TPA: aquaporin [Gemmatales bacterium]|nr:aquaporin [Gemmatales bacterium]HMP60599.1 aquaporin [Gemmatales bacterium]